MSTTVGALIVFLFVVAGKFKTVSAAAATIIESPNGWSWTEGSNITLVCRVSQVSSGLNADTICRTRIRFTKNLTNVAEGPRYSQSRGVEVDHSNQVNCNLTIVRVNSEDSGLFGCCWPDVEGNCAQHPTKTLNVIAATTAAPSTSTALPSTTGRRISTENNAVIYHTVSKGSGSTILSGGLNQQNEANIQKKGTSSLHKTLWPLLLIIALLVIIAILWRRHTKRKASDGQTIPHHDPENPGHVSHTHDQTIAMEGAIATTTITTTTTVVTRNSDEDLAR